ncbi:MAG: phosphoenolpyruvate carboxykinase [Caldisericia bacterium]|nr:phosphoenolpyruvate carboxykinase [Caldisericia bacterium]
MRTLYGGFYPENVIKNPSFPKIREMAKNEEVTTKNGSPSYRSKIMSRSAKFTEIVFDEPNKEQKELIQKALDSIKNRPMLETFRTMSDNSFCKLGCKLIVPVEYARLAYIWGNLLFNNNDSIEDITTIALPDWPERKVIVDAKNYVTYVFGTDYAGEIKKSFLRLGMWYVKQKLNCLGLHAGSKVLRIKDEENNLVDRGAIFFGLSGTGKSTLTCHDHQFEKPEGVIIRQDDVLFMNPKGKCFGSEQNFYIKTEGLEPKYQKVMYQAFMKPNAVLDNVCVNNDGVIDIEDCSRTTNGRAVIQRSEMDDTDETIDLEKVNMIFFITRREDIVPTVAKLNAKQAAAFFMLGESIETSAGDPEKAGQSKREVGTNPFIIGSKSEEGIKFRKMVAGMDDVECFLINTGKIGGANGKKISVKDTTDMIKQIARKRVTWKKDDFWDYYIPESIDNMDITYFDLNRYYSKEELVEKNKMLYKERIEWLKQFPELPEEILESLIKL